MSMRATKTLVLILLAIAAVDLLVPGLCLAEAPSPAGADSSPGAPPGQGDAPLEIDDCFCCCAHVVPEYLQALEHASDEVTSVEQAAPQRPRVKSTRLERPPRT